MAVKKAEQTIREVKKSYVLDSTAFLLNPFVVYILTGNDIPEEDLEHPYLEALAKLERAHNSEPNDLYVHELVEKDLRTYAKSSNQNIAFNARLAEIVLERLKRAEGLKKYEQKQLMNGVDGVYTQLKNGARIHFINHDEDSQRRQSYSQSDTMETLVQFVRTLSDYLNKPVSRKGGRSCITPDAHDFDEQIEHAGEKIEAEKTEVIFVSQEPSARSRVLRNLCYAQELRCENIKEPAQLPTGITMHVKSKPLLELTSDPDKNHNLEELARHFCTQIYPNQVIALKEDAGGVEYRIAKLQDDGTFKLKKFQYTTLLAERKKINQKLQDWRTKREKKDLQDSADPIIQVRFDEQLHPKSKQEPYLELLCDESVTLVSANGHTAGKKLFAFLAGLLGVAEGKYDKVRYVRLKLDTNDDLNKHTILCDDALKEIFGYYKLSEPDKEKVEREIERMRKVPILKYEFITGIEDFAWKKEFVIVDKGQQFTRTQMKALIRRCGEATKLVILGDLSQSAFLEINRYCTLMTERNSGLAHMIERLSEDKNYGHITLSSKENAVLSETAKLAEKI